jgi:hypothetical protein
VGQPVATTAGGVNPAGTGTSVVGAELAGVEPALFVAVTVIRSVVPASTCFSW